MPNDYSVNNIRDYLKSEQATAELRDTIAGFSCRNLEVERFLHMSAIEFTRKGQSVTYLVTAKDDGQLVGYFTLTVRPLDVDINKFSKTVQRKILRVAQQRDASAGKYSLAAYLIAQFGKNFADGAEARISGADLMALALGVIRRAQRLIGGLVVFVETTDTPALLEFYNQQRFYYLNTRNDDDGTPLAQLLKVVDAGAV